MGAPSREYFHCNHHEVVVDPGQFLEFIERMAFFQDTQLADPVLRSVVLRVQTGPG